MTGSLAQFGVLFVGEPHGDFLGSVYHSVNIPSNQKSQNEGWGFRGIPLTSGRFAVMTARCRACGGRSRISMREQPSEKELNIN